MYFRKTHSVKTLFRSQTGGKLYVIHSSCLGSAANSCKIHNLSSLLSRASSTNENWERCWCHGVGHVRFRSRSSSGHRCWLSGSSTVTHPYLIVSYSNSSKFLFFTFHAYDKHRIGGELAQSLCFLRTRLLVINTEEFYGLASVSRCLALLPPMP